MRWVAWGVLAVTLVAGCGGTSSSDAASLYESKYGAQNVSCKEASVSSFYECTAHRDGESGARAMIEIGDHEEVTVEKCTAIDPSAPNEPCTGIGVVGDESVP
jgi:hypothetical protein